jgi:hypothetical protein
MEDYMHVFLKLGFNDYGEFLWPVPITGDKQPGSLGKYTPGIP